MFRAIVAAETVGEYPTFTEAFCTFSPRFLELGSWQEVTDSGITWVEEGRELRFSCPVVCVLAQKFGLIDMEEKLGELLAPESFAESPTFEVIVRCENVGEYPTFTEAFQAFYHAVQTMIREGTSWQVLETACWIKWYEGGSRALILDFYQARDLAHDLGLLTKSGELVEPPEES